MKKDLQDFKKIQTKDRSQAKASAMKNQLRNLIRNLGSIKATTFTAPVKNKPRQQTEVRFHKRILS